MDMWSNQLFILVRTKIVALNIQTGVYRVKDHISFLKLYADLSQLW